MSRKVLDPAGFKFADGTVVPCGSILNITGRAEHFDPGTDGHRSESNWLTRFYEII
jgi:hypothetical protein